MTEIKTINISGEAARDISGGNLNLKKGKRNTRKNQNGGSADTVRGVNSVMNVVKGVESSQLATTSASPNTNSWLKYPAEAPVPPRINMSSVPSQIPATPNQVAAPTGQYAVATQSGGTKHIRVELKKKHTAKKVHLNPKKIEASKPQISKKNATRKARKVTLGVSNLHKRMTRAKKLHKKVKEMPIDKLKAQLVKGGFIKENSKAPESVLRQIATDAEVVAKKAL
jgi:hypothetical protein